MEMPSFLLVLDPYLIWFYRLPSDSYAGFLLGTLVLAVFCLIIGEITNYLAQLLVGRHMENHASEALKYGDLSLDAAKAGDKQSYQAANKLANEAFGKSFFSLISLSMARLWPLPFALAWMGLRFGVVEFPVFPGFSLGYVGAFILVYAAAYLLLKRVYKLLAGFPRLKGLLHPLGGNGKEIFPAPPA